MMNGYWSIVIRVLTLALLSSAQLYAHEGDHEHQHIKKPRVLILGDSISMGYTPHVQSMLADEADVLRPRDNCGPTTNGLNNLARWLGDEPWDVIHFNFGLHDLKHIDDSGALVPVEEGHYQVPLEQYERNLTELVRRLRETKATLVWCSTTPVPEGARGRIADDAVKYNQVAARVMRRELGDRRRMTDLHTFCVDKLAEIQRPANVHFTPTGSIALAEQVVASIRDALHPEFQPTRTARGVVYQDENANQVFDSGDLPLAGMKVSNGHEIVQTDPQGRYELPVDDDSIVFVIKPRGFRTPVDEKQLPQFYYVHKPAGSPASRFAGVAPTGPLPDSIDFPLYPQKEPEEFKAIMFGDPQPRDQKEVDYIAHDVVEELIGTDASLGVTLGDITFDNLDLFEPQARAIAVLGIPWYNVIGNHDINYDAKSDRQSDESFERVFGPSYYSFDYGPVHFLVLDDVEWLIDENGQGRYQGGLGSQQMEFIERDLALIPNDQLVVLMMHIPLTGVRDRESLYRLIEQRPFCMSISAHTHNQQHRFIKKEDGWMGPEPHHHVINVTVSGSWWSGAPDERGIPHTMMSDGAPNGYSVIRFNGQKYQIDYRVAGRDEDYQMSIHAPEVVDPNAKASVMIYANVFNGSERSQVTMAIADRPSTMMQYTVSVDPAYAELYAHETEMRDKLLAQGVPEEKLWRQIPKPGRSSHLWRSQLDIEDLQDGVHVIDVRAELGDGQEVHGKRLIRVQRGTQSSDEEATP